MHNRSILLSCLFLAACSGPVGPFPGGSIGGVEAPLVVPEESGVLLLETRPSDPYSVNLNYFLIRGAVYVDPTAERAWYSHLEDNPQARIRFSGTQSVHPVVAVRETDSEVTAQFESDRIVLRLDPR